MKTPAALCLLACLASTSFGQEEGELTAKARVLPSIGPGLHSVRVGADGNTYVLIAPANCVSVFGKDGKPAPKEVLRKRFHRLTFGHSELSGAQMWETAAEEGERAGLQALEIS